MRALERRVCKDEQRIRVCAVLFTAEYFFPLIVACYTICASKKKIIILLPHERYVLCNTEISPPLMVLHPLL